MKRIRTLEELHNSIDEDWKQINETLDVLYMDSVKEVKWIQKT